MLTRNGDRIFQYLNQSETRPRPQNDEGKNIFNVYVILKLLLHYVI